MSLCDILQKRAAEKSAARPIKTPLPAELRAPYEQGYVPAEYVDESLDEMAANLVERAVKTRRIRTSDAPALHTFLAKELHGHQRDLEDISYRKGQHVNAPVTPIELGVSGALQTAVPYGLSKLTGGGLTLGQAAKNVVHPSGFMPLAATTGALSLLKPLGDPRWRRGERGYFSSLHESVKGEADNLAEAGRNARERYGLAGVPIQAFHGMLNPIPSLYHGVTSMKDLIMGKEGQAMIARAETLIDKALFRGK